MGALTIASEIGSPEWQQQLKEFSEKKEREKVALLQAEALVQQWDVLKAAQKAVKDAQAAEQAAENKYTEMLAEAFRVRVGMRVRHTKGGQVKSVQYEVTHFSRYTANTLWLRGKQYRKDGTLGEHIHDIGVFSPEMRVEEGAEEL